MDNWGHEARGEGSSEGGEAEGEVMFQGGWERVVTERERER